MNVRYNSVNVLHAAARYTCQGCNGQCDHAFQSPVYPFGGKDAQPLPQPNFRHVCEISFS